jgi:CRISPR system Cascade subunit CasC
MLKDDDHLAVLSPEERKQVVRTFIEASLLAIPGARKNSMNAYTRPGYVLGIVRSKGHPIQLVNAFEKPIRPFGGKSLFECSLAELKKEHETLNNTWGLNSLVTVAVPEVNLDGFLNQVVAHVD